MKNWFSNISDRVHSFVNGILTKQFLAVVLVSLLLLTTNVNHGNSMNSQDITDRVLERVHENSSPRPKTTGEWQKEDRETANNPDERGRRITQQTGTALQEFGSGYVEAIKDASEDAQASVTRAGQQAIDQVKH